MKYFDTFEELEEEEYYYCVTYNDEDIVVQYLGKKDVLGADAIHMFSTDLTEMDIRYVVEKVDNLRERRKKFE